MKPVLPNNEDRSLREALAFAIWNLEAQERQEGFTRPSSQLAAWKELAKTADELMLATTVNGAIPVARTLTDPNGDKWLYIDAPNGWDDVKLLTKKVLDFHGEPYTFRAWNSDKNEAYFVKNDDVALIGKGRKR